jgi:type IV pilus assembly protein PilF
VGVLIRFITLSSALIGTLIISSCSSSRNNLKIKQANLYFGAGTQSLISKDYTEALKNLLEANKLDPKNPEIINNLAMAYYFKGEKDLAIEHLNQCLKIDSSNSDARMNLGSIYFKDGLFKEAEALYKFVLKDLTYERQARTLYNLGILEMEAKQNSVAAENYFKKSIKEDDNYCPSYFQLGLIQYKRKQFQTALKSFKEATMGSCYDLPAPHYYQAQSLIGLRRYLDARIKFDEIETKFKKSIYAQKSRAKIIEINQFEKIENPESIASRKIMESSEF